MPVSRLREGEAAALAADVHSVISGPATTPEAAPCPARAERLSAEASYPYRRVPIIKPHEKHVFQELWRQQLPVVIEEVELSGDWSAPRFADIYGDEDVVVTDSTESGDVDVEMKLRDFLELFTSCGKAVKLRVSHLHCWARPNTDSGRQGLSSDTWIPGGFLRL